MIVVDVYVPVLNKTYDFGIEPETPVASAIEEIVEMISQREQYILSDDGQKFMLCCEDSQRILPPQSTIASNRIKTGNRLILI